MKIRREDKNGKLQPKLTWTVLAVVFAAFFLVFVIVLHTSYNHYREQEINNQRYQLDKTAAQIRTLQVTTSNMAQQVIYDDAVQKVINMAEASTGDYLYSKRNAQRTLLKYSHIIDGISEIYIYTNDGRTISSRDVRGPFYPEKNDWYQEFLESGRSSGFSKIHLAEPSANGYTTEVVSFIMSYYSVGVVTEEIGKLIVEISFSELQEMAGVDTSMLKGYTLFDWEQKELITYGGLKYGYEEISDKSEDGIIQLKNGDVIIFSKELVDDWMLALEISGSSLMEKSIEAYAYLLLIFGLIIAVLLVTLRNSIRKIVEPINQLSEAAMDVGRGNFDISVQIHTKDELEMLADVFNRMVVDIRSLMHESVEHEKVLRRMEIENLMLQINPHFIYNTMNSIVYMARMNGNPQIADFANAFISLLQSTLDVRDSVFNTVRSELKNIENYLYLQKYRYDGKFTYMIDCDEELMDCQILNVMLQPAVENAIFHGIAPKEETCVLKISIYREGETLKLIVEDDGIGMSKETLEEQMKPGHVQKGGMRKIGVANVKDRIREIYGDPYSLIIESELDVGTKVIMTVPYKKEKKNRKSREAGNEQ